MPLRRTTAVLIAALLAAAPPAAAQDSVPDDAAAEDGAAAAPAELPPPIYEDKLLRLAEILGSLAFLRGLCGESDGPEWRAEMSALMAAEHPGPERGRRLVARFNHGFETYNAVYRACTPSAKLAISRYLEEGQSLAGEVRSRYSQ